MLRNTLALNRTCLRQKDQIQSLLSRAITVNVNLKEKPQPAKQHKWAQSTYSRYAPLIIRNVKSRNFNEVERICREGDENREVKQKGLIPTVDTYDLGENTPLTQAAKEGDTKGCEFLLTRMNANPLATCNCPDDKSPLHYATEGGHYETAKIIKDHGGDPNYKNAKGLTPIDVAEKKNNTKMITLLTGKQPPRKKEDPVIKITVDRRTLLPK